MIVLFIAYPVFEALRLSLYEIDLLSGNERYAALNNYVAVFNDPKFPRVLFNTFVWSVGSLIGQFVLGFWAALLINRDLPGMRLVRSILLMPYVVPVITVALCARWMLDGTYGILSEGLQASGLLGHNQSPLASPTSAMVSVIIANVWRSFPFVMIAYWAAMQGIPKEQYEAARIDGASRWQELRFVTLPNLMAVTVTLIMLRLFWTVTYFDLIWLMTQGGPGGATEHWPIWVHQEAMGFFRFGYAAAIAVTLSATLMLSWMLYAGVTRIRRAQ
ncbi:sugar ABC transporter permease [Mesorhizobium sp. LHD-90]|uniref:carbohydrate ABC transporter permease n=1 Tax=Mesorhizobium sp. LHD-90 TaxID=3071414 RepID=UPI0027DFBA1C|nr:sugar ABC transporter permease [Mesorhizobium sp. LHD-90]MDQ6438188.1 sugar ABC transporter permease [Mesorhizobium sp. LHD-90]